MTPSDDAAGCEVCEDGSALSEIIEMEGWPAAFKMCRQSHHAHADSLKRALAEAEAKVKLLKAGLMRTQIELNEILKERNALARVAEGRGK